MQIDGPDAAETSRPGRPSMPREQIVAATLELVDEYGADDFSLRSLAKRLHSSTATLYRHFASKEVLLSAVGELVLGEVSEALSRQPGGGTDGTESGDAPRSDSLSGIAGDSTDDRWRKDLVTAADALYRVFEAHPHMVAVLGDGIALGPNALVLREHVLAGLISGGFTPQIASKAFTSVMHYTIGFSAQLGRPDPSSGDSGRELQEFFAKLDPVVFPAVTASAAFLPVVLRDEFHFGLTCIISGLEPLRRREGAHPRNRS